MRLLNRLIMIGLISVLVSCENEKTADSKRIPDAKTALDTVTVLSQLKGVWFDSNDYYENWQIEGKSLKGKALTKRNDSLFVNEELELKKINDEWHYCATVLDQNNGSTILFKLDSLSANHIRFRNPDHDFPNEIEYHFSDSVHLFIHVGGKGRWFDLNLTRN